MKVWFNPPIDPTIVDIRIILSVKALISIRYDININRAAFCTVINSAQFSHLSPSLTPGNHQWSGAAPRYSSRGVQMIIDVYRFISNENRSSVNIFITTKNKCCWGEYLKYFNEASVLYIFLTLGIKGINDIRLISRPIHAPSHELEDTDTNAPPAKVISRRIFCWVTGH